MHGENLKLAYQTFRKEELLHVLMHWYLQ